MSYSGPMIRAYIIHFLPGHRWLFVKKVAGKLRMKVSRGYVPKTGSLHDLLNKSIHPATPEKR